MKLTETSKLIYMSLLISMALVLSLIERTIPVPFIVPGAKLGLANLIIVISIYTLDKYRESFLVLILRLLLSTLLGGSVSMLLYSSCGGVLSYIITVIVKKLGGKYVSVIGVSTSGAVFHNVGQLFAASLVLNNFGVYVYLPLLSITGIVTGFFVGLSANYILNHFKKMPQFRDRLKSEASL